MNAIVPWNATWSSEQRYEIRPCRWASGKLALWQPHSPGVGAPVFAKPHNVRQRRSVAQFLCTVCGEHTPVDDRWWFRLGHVQDGYFMTTESPVHRRCADLAFVTCPHLRWAGLPPTPFPANHTVLAAIVGEAATERDFGDRINGRRVVGHLKFAWPMHRVHWASEATILEGANS